MYEYRPRGYRFLPPVVKNLIIINLLFVLLQYILFRFGINLADYLGLHYWKSSLFRPWQFITHMFMHGSPGDIGFALMHLFGNMLALWVFGSELENRWGTKRFIVFYLICGVGAALCQMGLIAYEYQTLERAVIEFQHNPTVDQFGKMLVRNDWDKIPDFAELRFYWEHDPANGLLRARAVSFSNQILYGYNDPVSHRHLKGIFDGVMVGASGAVFGVMFAFGYLMPNAIIIAPPIYFPLKAKYVVAIYAAAELYALWQPAQAERQGIAHFAHLGGMLVAYILLRIWMKGRRQRFY